MSEETEMSAVVAFYQRQFRLLWRWTGSGPAMLLRGLLVVAASLAAFAFTAWYIPGVAVSNVPAAIVAAAGLAWFSALTRPLLVRFLSRISVLLVGLATLALQAGALLVVARLVPGITVDRPQSAAAAAVLYSVSHTIIAASLSLANDESFFGTLVRQLAARDRGPRETRTGVIVVQIDGLAHPVLERAMARGDVPTLARWSKEMRLDRWQPLLPTQTSASQAGILYGTNDAIPAFRWWDKAEGRLFVSNHPRDARAIAERLSNGDGLLKTGASIGNLFSGDAERSFLTASTVDASEARRSHVLDWFFISPYSFVRWMGLSVGEILTEIVQAQRERVGGGGPSGARAFPYPFARAATNVLLRHLVGALVIEQMYERTPVIYVDFVDYDEIAHHAGVERLESRRALRGIDRIIALLEKAALDAPRPYRFVALSDHGQSPGPMFRQRNGKKLEDLIADLMGEDIDVHAATTPVERAGRASLHGAVAGIDPRGIAKNLPGTDKEPPELVVAASGNLAQVSFPRMPGRVTREQLEERYPDLVARLVSELGIGLVLVATKDGSIVFGRSGWHRLRDDRVEGADPIAPYGDHALDGLRRVDAMPNCGDLLLLSEFVPATGEVFAFEEQVGSHGGLGGAQSEGFVLHPEDLVFADAMIGAPALHAPLRDWIRRVVS